uniref:DDE_3 domain-containing protein n=1 Tax=Strongyloides venezuelensis TaxID=75913 RepID=A0A0K0G522_STRVS
MNSEAVFYLNGLIEKHNCKRWGMSNPMAVNRIMGPYFFENESGNLVTVNAQNYRDMIQNYLIPKLEDTKGMLFVQNEYPAHNDKKTTNLLKIIFDNRLISTNSIVKWPG